MLNICSPIMVTTKPIKNRVVVPPMADFGSTKKDGKVNERHLKHYRSFAQGGAGLIIIEACAVSSMNEPRNTIALFDDSFLPGLTLLASAAKTNGAAALVQLLNTGLLIMQETAIAQISRRQFLQYKEDFISAASRCKQAGFDGVELHAAHGFYLNQIVETSARDDEYGGSLKNRVRILKELISEIKKKCGKGFIVGVRFGSSSQDELQQIAKELEDGGADILHVSSGCGPTIQAPQDFPFGNRIYMASLVKKVVNIPVIGVGGIENGEQGEAVLASQYADMVAVGRGHLCDPAWANKVLAGDEPIRCLRCRECLWYLDGEKCPVRRRRQEIS